MDPATRDRVLADFPAYVYLADDPEVGPLLEQAANEGWSLGQLQGKLFATAWWRSTSETSRIWGAQVQTDPAEANRLRAIRSSEIVTEAMRLGVQLSDAALAWITETSLQQGSSRQQITQAITLAVRQGAATMTNTGDLRRNTQQVRQIAREFGYAISPDQHLNFAHRIADGSLTLEGVRAEMVERAKDKWGKNSGIMRGLERGLTVWDIMQPVIGRVSQELGVSPDSFDLTEGWGAQLVNYRDPGTGELRMMNDTEATAWARSQRQWRDTNSGKSLASQLVDGITQRMGRR